ncbi:hypothetical protein BGZ75_009264 [Mortierella antarctica]|nr:hypothetical protein BGZ75_009264 [Mortierella antarctica]
MSETSHLQTFRCKSRLLDLPVYLESKTHDYIVLWHDVKPLFPGARCVMNGNKVVPFLKDESFQTIIPERIKYQPDVVLDVILENANTSTIQVPMATESSSSSTPSPIKDAASTTQDGEILDIRSDEIMVAGGDADLSENQTSQAPGDLQVVMHGASSQVTEFKSIENLMNERFGHMNERFSDLNAVLDDIKVLQVEILEMQKQMQDMQKQTLDRLATIQSRIQAVFTETQELYQYPIPRLFIVLPRSTRYNDKALLAKKFRLYFLCECGEHRNVNGTKSQHKIHLAKHEGYELENPVGFLETSLGAVGIGDKPAKSPFELDQQEAFEGVDLRLLESYLRIPDRGRTLGNLYRIVTLEGGIVEINGGSYNPAEGLVHIKLMSKTLARQFYEVLAKAQRVQERPARDFLNSGRRFNPLVDLMSSGQVQSLDLKNFSAFYERIGTFPLVKTPLLRALRINTDIVFGSSTKKGEKSLLTSLLQNRQSLDKLTLHCVDIAKVFDFITGAIPSHRTINFLRLRSSSAGCTLMLDISKGAVCTMTATLRNGIREPGLASLLLSGHLAQLTIKRLTSSQQDKDILAKVFSSNTSLREIHCLCNGLDYQEHISVFSSIRKSGQQTRASGDDLRLYRESETKDGFDAHSNVHMGDLKYSSCDDTTYHNHLRLYGWTVQALTTNSAFSDDHAQQFLNSLDGKKSKLTKLSLVTGSLSTEGLHFMSRIISASPLLNDLDLHFDDLHNHERLDAATVIPPRHGAQMTGLTLNGKTALQWLQKFCTGFAARTAWPKLKSLGLVRAHENSAEEATTVVHELAEGVAKWIAAMVMAHTSASSVVEAPSSPTNGITTVQPLRNIYLENIRLIPEAWTLITEAMDITALESVSFKCSSIESIQLDALKDLLPDDISVTLP